MIINGTNYKILPDFQPEFLLALKWNQMSSGNWYAVDRTNISDVYASNFSIYGKEDAINAFISELENNRVAGGNVLTMTSFTSTEHIFGADIDYSGNIYAVVDSKPAMRRTQGTWRGWGLSLRVVGTSPLFQSISPALPPLRLINVGVDADSDYTIDRTPSYNNTYSHDDHSADFGTFKGTFTFTDKEMARFRRFMATNRSATVTIPKLYGIRFPFGRRSVENPTNFPVKIIAWENEKMRDITRWTVDLTLAEVI
jgi:hypothetical protein